MNIKELTDFIESLRKRDDPLTPQEKARVVRYLCTLEYLALRISGDWEEIKRRTMKEVM